MSKFKVGDRVRVVSIKDRHGHTCADWVDSGGVGRVDVVSGVSGMAEGYQVYLEGGSCYEPRMLELAAPLTKEQRAIAKAEAELAKLKERAAAKAKQAADRKAKTERAKIMRGLSAAGRRVVAMLQAGSASDFGCQRESVIKLASAITGDDPEKIKKALL